MMNSGDNYGFAPSGSAEGIQIGASHEKSKGSNKYEPNLSDNRSKQSPVPPSEIDIPNVSSHNPPSSKIKS